MISLDTETTGVDLRHGAKPYLVTICDEDDNQTFWEWDVDPLTREPEIPDGEWAEIAEEMLGHDYVLQNPRFDVTALRSVFNVSWDWSRTYDTLLASHLLASNQPHDLTTLALINLNVNVQPYEDAIHKAVTRARDRARRFLPEWRIAKDGLPDMPSAKANVWKADMWLPRAICKLAPELLGDWDDWTEGRDPVETHPWWSLCADYANSDSAVTLPIFKVQKAELEERGLWDIYVERLKLLDVADKMESRGITLSEERLNKLCKEYKEEADKAGRICVNIAREYGAELELPKSGVNGSLRETMFEAMDFPRLEISKKTGQPSVNKGVIDTYLSTLPQHSKELLFVKRLAQKRKRDTAVSYMESYKRYWLPLGNGWWILHPSLNPTGTATLRWSCKNPNEQNISKQEGFNLRYCFGPAPGREWWSLDAKNIELRIPAYEAGETEMIELFENEDEPPYYGSYHMLIFDTLHPEKFAKHGMECKKIYASTWYQWTKNGNFAVQYGAIESSGTADRAYHVDGAQRKVQKRFAKLAKLNQRMIDLAEANGYVETMPDKTVDPNRGYPLECKRHFERSIKPTIPLNYHVQGTAMWWMGKSMTRCQHFLDGLNLVQQPTSLYYLVMQVHDELVFDFPAAPSSWDGKPHEYNLQHVDCIQKLMQQGGDDLGLPTPVSKEYHANNWGEGESV